MPSHVGTKYKAENKQLITNLLQEERNLKLFFNWLFAFSYSFCAHMRRHPNTSGKTESAKHKVIKEKQKGVSVCLLQSHIILLT